MTSNSDNTAAVQQPLVEPQQASQKAPVIYDDEPLDEATVLQLEKAAYDALHPHGDMERNGM